MPEPSQYSIRDASSATRLLPARATAFLALPQILPVVAESSRPAIASANAPSCSPRISSRTPEAGSFVDGALVERTIGALIDETNRSDRRLGWRMRPLEIRNGKRAGPKKP